MTDLGRLIYRTADDEGEIYVYQDRRFRYLTFGNAVEQSCMDLANPLRLEHIHTQAMMLGLLFSPEARRLALLGMGGGSLARALLAASRGAHIQAVDHRASVVEVARTYFDLPDDSRFSVSCEDAHDFLQSQREGYDLIFSDLYLAEGVHPGQASTAFVQLCRERLSDAGILVINQWASEFQANREASNALAELFDERTLHLHVHGGNIIAFAFCGPLPDLKRDGFFSMAQSLGLRLDIPLQRHARNLWRQNAEILGVGRFRQQRVR
jgi:spermidine synthase